MAVVIAFHLFLLLLAGRWRNPPLSQWGRRGSGDAMSISLVGASSLSTLASAQPNTATQTPVTPPAPLSDSESLVPQPAPTSADATAASDAPSQQVAATQPGHPGEAGADGVASETPVAFDRDPYAHASLMLKPDPAALDTVRLRLQAARCWKAAPNTSAVTLSVTLNAQGMVVGTPTPVHHEGFGDDVRQAEVAAIKAVQDCAPYTTLASGPVPETRVREILLAPTPAEASPRPPVGATASR